MVSVAGSGFNAARGSIQSMPSLAKAESAGSGKGPVQLASIPAYYNSRSLPNLHMKPTYREEYMHKVPGQAATVLDVDLFQHQSIPMRQTPHPLEGGQQNRGYDDRRQFYWFGGPEQRWRRHWLP